MNYLNIQIVTDQHIVDINQLGLFSRKISELSLSEIQDISATKRGIFESFYDYGDICVQTAGEKPNFNFERVPDPDGLSQRIIEIKDKYGRIEVREVPDESPATSADKPAAPPDENLRQISS